MTVTSVSPTVDRPRTALTAAAFAISALLAAQAIVWLFVPDSNPFAGATPVLLAAVFGPEAAAAVALTLGAAGASAAIVLRSARRASAGWARLSASIIVGVAGFGLIGFSSLALAGYALVGLLPFGIIASLALFARKHPWIAACIGLLCLVLVTAGEVSGVLPLSALAPRVVSAMSGGAGVAMIATVSVVAFTGAWLLQAVRGLQKGRTARVVLRHRVPITVAAAACCLPYVISRLSWLTPWPLFGSPAAFPEDQRGLVFATGLALGAAMAVGGLLTLGLILPWGERLPRWMGPLADRPVPPLLAVIPALVVGALFTFSGVSIALEGFAGKGPLADMNWTMGLVLPFWLWGPLLAMSAWGYWLHNRPERAAQ